MAARADAPIAQPEARTEPARERRATAAGATARAAPGELVHRRWVTATLVLASMIYSIDWTIAAVALPHMQGTFSVTQDQISWVLTSYIVAQAIATPITGWLSDNIGRKNLFMICVGGFVATSALCGTALGLEEMVFFRILQEIGRASCRERV